MHANPMIPLVCAVALFTATAHAADTAPAEQRLRDAQQRLEQAANEVAELSLAAGDGARRRIQVFRTGGDGPMLGIGIDTGDAADGVRIISVSPGGPADEAGLKANDVIKSFDGKALRRSGAQSAADQLLATVRATRDGETVELEYERAGKVSKLMIAPRRLPGQRAAAGIPRALEDFSTFVPNGALRLQSGDAAGFGGAELVELSPGLGKYFGIDKGLLVVRAPRDSQLKLQDGDVLLDIDGRIPASVSHAYQILNSYRPREAVKLHIMRQQKRMELPVVMPGAALEPQRRRNSGGSADDKEA
jgi:S1-C subfamily serine protease